MTAERQQSGPKKTLFSDKVEFPNTLKMGEEELAEAAQLWDNHWVEGTSEGLDKQERESINQSNFICIAHIHKPQFVS